MKWYRPGDVLREFLPTNNLDGDAESASAMTLAFARNGTVDVAVTVTATLKGTGLYELVATIPADYEYGDHVAVLVLATVNDTTAWFTAVSERLIDMPTAAALAASIGAGQINIISPFDLGDAVNVYAGDDYSSANGTALTISITDRADLIGMTPKIYLYADELITAEAAPVVSATQSIEFEFTKAQTGTLRYGAGGNPHEGRYQVKFIDPAGKVETTVDAILYVRKGLNL